MAMFEAKFMLPWSDARIIMGDDERGQSINLSALFEGQMFRNRLLHKLSFRARLSTGLTGWLGDDALKRLADKTLIRNTLASRAGFHSLK
jgi:hypothetical protein